MCTKKALPKRLRSVLLMNLEFRKCSKVVTAVCSFVHSFIRPHLPILSELQVQEILKQFRRLQITFSFVKFVNFKMKITFSNSDTNN